MSNDPNGFQFAGGLVVAIIWLAGAISGIVILLALQSLYQ